VLLVLTMAAMFVVDGYWVHRADRSQARTNMNRGARHLGSALSTLVEHVWQSEGAKKALALLRDANERHKSIVMRWVWLDAEPSDPQAPRVPDRREIQASLEQEESIEDRQASPPTLYTYVVSRIPGPRAGAIELAQSLASLDAQTATTFKRTVMLLVGLLVASVGTILLIGIYFVGRPLQLLKDKAERAGAGDLSRPLDLPGKAELSELADALNDMCDHLAESRRWLEDETAAKLEALEQARHTDRLRTVGRLASGIAHELGTPLNVVSGRAALIARRHLDEDQTRESAEIIISQAERMTGIIRQLLSFARRGSAEKHPCRLTEVARQAVALVEPIGGKRGVHILLQAPENGATNGLCALCNPAEIQQVFINLLVNAIQASPTDSEVNIQLGLEPDARRPGHADGPGLRSVRVAVQDRGAGIPDSDLPHVFEPFFTTKDVGEGTGLGLSIVHGIVEDHGGWITVDSKAGGGSCFTFHIPSADAK
jgi:two-component system, NtrC family, sensor kinase